MASRRWIVRLPVGHLDGDHLSRNWRSASKHSGSVSVVSPCSTGSFACGGQFLPLRFRSGYRIGMTPQRRRALSAGCTTSVTIAYRIHPQSSYGATTPTSRSAGRLSEGLSNQSVDQTRRCPTLIVQDLFSEAISSRALLLRWYVAPSHSTPAI